MRWAAALLVLLAGCGSCKNAKEEQSKPAPPCREDATKKVGANGQVTSCVLAKPFAVDGYTCEWGKPFELWGDGKLRTCYLREAKTVDGTSCHDHVDFHPNGKLHRCRLYATRKNVVEGVDLRAGDWVSFYDSGKVERIELVIAPVTISGLTCKGHENWFHENGKLKKCELAQPEGVTRFACFDDRGERLPACP